MKLAPWIALSLVPILLAACHPFENVDDYRVVDATLADAGGDTEPRDLDGSGDGSSSLDLADVDDTTGPPTSPPADLFDADAAETDAATGLAVQLVPEEPLRPLQPIEVIATATLDGVAVIDATFELALSNVGDPIRIYGDRDVSGAFTVVVDSFSLARADFDLTVTLADGSADTFPVGLDVVLDFGSVVHVALGTGMDGDGTEANPFSSLGDALGLAQEATPPVLIKVIGDGTESVNASFALESVTIAAGWDGAWDEASSERASLGGRLGIQNTFTTPDGLGRVLIRKFDFFGDGEGPVLGMLNTSLVVDDTTVGGAVAGTGVELVNAPAFGQGFTVVLDASDNAALPPVGAAVATNSPFVCVDCHIEAKGSLGDATRALSVGGSVTVAGEQILLGLTTVRVTGATTGQVTALHAAADAVIELVSTTIEVSASGDQHRGVRLGAGAILYSRAESDPSVISVGGETATDLALGIDAVADATIQLAAPATIAIGDLAPESSVSAGIRCTRCELEATGLTILQGGAASSYGVQLDAPDSVWLADGRIEPAFGSNLLSQVAFNVYAENLGQMPATTSVGACCTPGSHTVGLSGMTLVPGLANGKTAAVYAEETAGGSLCIVGSRVPERNRGSAQQGYGVKVGDTDVLMHNNIVFTGTTSQGFAYSTAVEATGGAVLLGHNVLDAGNQRALGSGTHAVLVGQTAGREVYIFNNALTVDALGGHLASEGLSEDRAAGNVGSCRGPLVCAALGLFLKTPLSSDAHCGIDPVTLTPNGTCDPTDGVAALFRDVPCCASPSADLSGRALYPGDTRACGAANAGQPPALAPGPLQP